MKGHNKYRPPNPVEPRPATRSAPAEIVMPMPERVFDPGSLPGAGPTEEQIRLRAYQIWRARGGFEGDPVSDWLKAERELIEERKRSLSD